MEGFGFKEKENIRGIGSDQCSETSNCSWMSNPSVVLRENLHMLLGDTTWSPKLIEPSFSNTAEMKLEVGAKAFFFSSCFWKL
jgi:hypothetical protein